MVHCEECRKKLSVLQGYKHPALGKRFPVCRNCYDMVSRNMEKWSKFCLSDSFNKESSKIEIQDAWSTNLSRESKLQKWFNILWIKLG